MNSHTSKNKERTGETNQQERRAVAHTIPPIAVHSPALFQFVDNRSHTAIQRKLLEKMNSDSPVKQLKTAPKPGTDAYGTVIQRNEEGWTNNTKRETFIEFLDAIKSGDLKKVEQKVKWLQIAEKKTDPKTPWLGGGSTFWDDMRSGDFKTKDFIGPLHWLPLITSGTSHKEDDEGLKEEDFENYQKIHEVLRNALYPEGKEEPFDFSKDWLVKNNEKLKNAYTGKVTKKKFLEDFLKNYVGAYRDKDKSSTTDMPQTDVKDRKVPNSKNNATYHLEKILKKESDSDKPDTKKTSTPIHTVNTPFSKGSGIDDDDFGMDGF